MRRRIGIALRAAALLGAAACGVTACGADRGEAAARGDTASGSTAIVRPAGLRPTPTPPARYGIGRAASAAEIAAWNIDVGADGRALPAGRGTAAQGAALYARKCAACHGARGEGMGQGHAAYPRLVGRDPRDGFPFGEDFRQVKTIGNYWPHATTLFDYVRRAMPLTAPGTLSDDETYALVAYLLAENEIVGRDVVMDARALRAVRMPARDRFVPDDRRDGPGFR